jgi:uncharacterized protein involved in exopolysaccharide biosynthesis
MVDQAATPQPTLADLLEWVLRRWWIVVLSVLVAAGASLLAVGVERLVRFHLGLAAL